MLIKEQIEESNSADSGVIYPLVIHPRGIPAFFASSPSSCNDCNETIGSLRAKTMLWQPVCFTLLIISFGPKWYRNNSDGDTRAIYELEQ
jgi:hypothetical protein